MVDPRKVLLHPDPAHDGWWIADGHNLLKVGTINLIPTVERHAQGIAFHEEYRSDVVAALSTAGCRTITDTRSPSTPAPSRADGHNHRVYVADTDNLTVLPDNTPGGHWADESGTCPKCNPAHAVAAGTHRREAIAAVRAATHAIATRGTTAELTPGTTPVPRDQAHPPGLPSP